MITEEWREIAGCNGLYDVSSHGRVRSYNKPGAPGHRRAYPIILKPQPNGKYGYLFVHLGRDRSRYVHHLVLEAFVGHAPDGHECEHCDGNTANNSITNLYWVTHQENMKAIRKRNPTCKKGHSYEGNEIWNRGRRTCRICARARERCRRRVISAYQ